MEIFEVLAVFFAGVSLGALGTLALIVWAATRIKSKDKAE